MRILIIGCWSELGTNTAMYYALKNLGHTVEFFNYIEFGTWRLKESLTATEVQISNVCKNMCPDLIIVCKGEHLSPFFLHELSKNYATVLYHFMDPRKEFNRIEAEFLARECHYRNFTSSKLAEKYDGFQVFEGYGPKVWYKKDTTKEYDVTFVGGLDDHRKDYIDSLEFYGVNVNTFNGLSYEEVNDVYNKSKIVLNFVRDPDIISDRVVQALATNTVLLTEFSPELFKLHNWFRWTNFVFIDKSDLFKKIEYISKYYDKQLEIKNTFPIENFTWEKQMEKMLKKIQ